MTLAFGLCGFATGWAADAAPGAPGGTLGTLPPPVACDRLVDPRRYSEYRRRGFAAPTWETFDHRPQLVGGRYHGVDWNVAAADLTRLIPPGEPMDDRPWFVGRVYRPDLGIMHAAETDMRRGLDRMQRNGMFLFNIGGYGPGSPWKGSFGQARVREPQLRLLHETLGDRFFGFDLGEQDGRYHNLFEKAQLPSPRDATGQHRLFHDWCDRVIDDQGGRLSMLTVLWNWHHPVRDGAMTLIGAECQNKHGVANAQVQYAFLRGAGKQYGVLWFGDVSVFSTFGVSGWHLDDDGRLVSEPGGSSANLMRRLFLSQWLWNCCILGFEGKTVAAAPAATRAAHAVPSRPSPIGLVQMGVEKMLQQGFTPGVMQTPVAILLDGLSGWMPPRTNRAAFRTWNDLPYEAHDHFVDGVLSMLYPGYEDCGCFMDERGCLSAAPHGDIADCLLGDASAESLSRYSLVICGGIDHDVPGVRERLESFTANGGTVVAVGSDAARLWPEWFGDRDTIVPEGRSISWESGEAEISEPQAFVLRDMRVPPGGAVLATCAGKPVVVRVPNRSGAVIVLCATTGLPRDARPCNPPRHPTWGGENSGLERPYPLLRHVHATLDEAIASQRLFTAGEGLAVTTCRRDERTFTLGVMNPGLTSRPFAIVSHIGAIAAVQEVEVDPPIHALPGYWPHAWGTYDPRAVPPRQDLGELRGDSTPGDPARIGGGDLRLFTVTLSQCSLRQPPPVDPAPPTVNRLLAMPDLFTLRERLLAWPAFVQTFDGVAIDWRSLQDTDPEWLVPLCRWLDRHGIRLLVDARDAAEADVPAVVDKLCRMEGRRDLVHDGLSAEISRRVEALGMSTRSPSAVARLVAGAAAGSQRSEPIEVLESDWRSWDAIARDARAAWHPSKRQAITSAPPVLSAKPTPTRASPRRFLAVHDAASPEAAVAVRPGFHDAFNGLMLDADWMLSRSDAAIDRDRQWLEQSRMEVIIDFTRSLNAFPDLTFSPVVPHRREVSVKALESALAKMSRLGARHAVACSHMRAESVDDWAGQREGIEQFLRTAAEAKITVHWRASRHRPPGGLAATAALVAELRATHANLRLAAGTVEEPGPAKLVELTEAAGPPELWLLAAPAGPMRVGTVFLPLSTLPRPQLAAIARAAGHAAAVFDADYESWEEVLADVAALQDAISR